MNDRVSDDPCVRRSWPARLLRPKLAIPTTLLLLTLISPWLIRTWNLREVPDIPDPVDVDALRAIEVPDHENAWIEYSRAIAAYVDMPASPILKREEARRKWVEDNNSALSLWQLGSEKPRCLLPASRLLLDRPSSFHLGVDEAIVFRRVAGLLTAKTRTVHDDAGPGAAWEWHRVALYSAAHATQNGGKIIRSAGQHCFGIAFADIEVWSTDLRLSGDQLLNARRDLEAAWQRRGTLRATLKFDYLEYHVLFEALKPAMLSEETKTSRFLWYLAGESVLSERLIRIRSANQLAAAVRPIRELQALSIAGNDFLIGDSSGKPVGVPNVGIAEYQSAMERSLLGQSGFVPPSGWTFLVAETRSIAEYECLRATLALQAYYRNRSRFPESLAELVPDYIPEVPADPFDVKSLKYRVDAEGVVVYSVYKNQLDDGGAHYSPDQRGHFGSTEPTDWGLRVRVPGEKPLVAPRP